MKVRIIAEAGENHLGDRSRMVEMIRMAAASGADFIKFQSYDVDDLAPGVPEETREWILRTQLTAEDHHRLKAEAERSNIAFLSTPVTVRWAELLCEMGLSQVKIASMSLTNEQLLRYVGDSFDEIFLSTGMGSEEEIERALDCLGDRPRVVILHCVSEYPTPDSDASLLSLVRLRGRFARPIGYSDHTIGTTAAIAACALGAEVIEKHFTLDKTLEGTDHICSADPAEMAAIAHGCHRVARMLGVERKEPTSQELKNRTAMRALFQSGR